MSKSLMHKRLTHARGRLRCATTLAGPFLMIGAGLLALSHPAQAQQSILGRNLIVNGDAEAGPAGTLSAQAASIPNWVRTGNTTVLPYGLTGYVLLNDPAPPDHAFQYFYAGDAGAGASTLVQTIDVSSGASALSAGNIKFTASAWLGATGGRTAGVTVAFQNAGGQTFSTSTLGPLTLPGPPGMTLQQQIGLVPTGTARVTVTLSFSGAYAAADSLSLVFSTLSTTPVLGANLIANPGAEAGPSAQPPGLPTYVPGWSTSGDISVTPYGGTGWISLSAPGPSDRGINLFAKASPGDAVMYQDLDVTGAASLIDAKLGAFQVSAWMGGLSGVTAPTLVYTFFDWAGNQLAATAQLGPVTHSGTSLVLVSQSGSLPAGTRRVHVELDFFAGTDDGMVDNISFSIGNASAPVIAAQGIVPVYSTATTIQAGSWVSIYGTNLAASTATWNGDFPTVLANTSVTIDSKPAYLWFVSPTQINLQVPDDSASGTVPVVVSTAAGSYTSSVTLGRFGPSFSLFNSKYAAGLVVTPGLAGNSGGGYDLIGPANALAFTTRPVRAGETLLLYGVGFGPTTPNVQAGALFSGAAPCITMPSITIGGVPAQVKFAGIVEAGLFQFNVIVPSAGSGDKLLQAMAGGVTTPANVYITLQ